MRKIICIVCLSLIGFQAFGQETSLPETEDILAYKEESKRLVSFIQFMFNTLGGTYATAKEKDIIITQSFQKAFLNSEVQVEDDLAENRAVVTNKDVQAYLKDIDFFFKEVRFEFEIEDVSHNLNEENQLYFRVSTSRNLQGISVEGDSINASQKRYFEINLDEERRDLKVVSIYTTKLSEKEELTNWWNDLPISWKLFLGERIQVDEERNMRDILLNSPTAFIGDTLLLDSEGEYYASDSSNLIDIGLLDASHDPEVVPWDTLILKNDLIFGHLRQIVALEELDISEQADLFELGPLAQLTQLQRLDLSNTPVSNLVPLRNLTKLVDLDITGTQITDLSPLKYAIQIKNLRLSHTKIKDISILANMPELVTLHCYNSGIRDLTPIANAENLRDVLCFDLPLADISPLEGLGRLEFLKLSNTLVSDLSSLSTLKNLKTLDIEGTPVSDLGPLAGTKRLERLFCEKTLVSKLSPLLGLAKLRNVYCDGAQVDQVEANNFMNQHPQALVIYASENLINWWKAVPLPWQKVFERYTSIPTNPTREQLHELLKIHSIDIRDNTEIQDFEPLKMLMNINEVFAQGTSVTSLEPLRNLAFLEKLNISRTGVVSLEPLKELSSLETLSLNHTKIRSLEAIRGLDKLKTLNCDNSPVSDLSPIEAIAGLKNVYCDNSGVNVNHVRQLNTKALIVFQTDSLYTWWQGLSGEWKKVFRSHSQVSQSPDRDQLHALIYLRKINIAGNRSLTKLNALDELLHLENLQFEDTPISDLSPLSKHQELRILECAQNPVSDLGPLVGLDSLVHLNIDNTPVSSIMLLEQMPQLQELHCAGTQIRDAKPLAFLKELTYLDISNTNIKNISSLEGLTQLKSLICYNTKISPKKIEKFKTYRQETQVVYY